MAVVQAGPRPGEPRLQARGLRAGFWGPLSLSLAPAECVCLSGPSGSGKSLLLRAIADLDPHEGEVSLDGLERESMAPWDWRHTVGLLPPESAWWADTVGEHFAAPPAPEQLQSLALSPQAMDWEVMRLSSGERQRLALLRLLQNRPRVLLLDEPTANLDPTSAERVESLLQAYRQRTGAALLWVSHDPGQADRVSSRHLRLEGGRLARAS